MRIALLAAAILLSAESAYAENQTIVAVGLGGDTCAEFGMAYKNDPVVSEILYYHWAQGFMSGQNLAPVLSRKPVKDLTSVSVESQKVQIRAYCDKHPLVAYMQAVSDVYDTLKTVSSD
jgi:hypothetical protein